MPEVTIYRKVINVGMETERAFYAIRPKDEHHPVARIVGDFRIDDQCEPRCLIVASRR